MGKKLKVLIEHPPGYLVTAPARVTSPPQRVEQLEMVLTRGQRQRYENECRHIGSIYDNEECSTPQKLYIVERVIAGLPIKTVDVVRLRKTTASDLWLKAEGLV